MGRIKPACLPSGLKIQMLSGAGDLIIYGMQVR